MYHYRRHDSNSSSDVESLDAAYRHLFEVVFADVSPERAALRPMAMARADVILAWQSLNDRREPARALTYLDRAARRWPPLRRTVEYWRLRGAATALRASGPKGYAVLRSANAGCVGSGRGSVAERARAPPRPNLPDRPVFRDGLARLAERFLSWTP